MERKEVIFVLLEQFADWEASFLNIALNMGTKPGRPVKYKVKTLSLTGNTATSGGGFKVITDYNLSTVPEDYAGIILIGGMTWEAEHNLKLLPLIRQAVEKGAVVAGICMASAFLAIHGFLNEVKHTSNTLDFLKRIAGDKYTGEANYIHQQAVGDKNIVTGNGTGYLEFTKEVLLALNADTPEEIEAYYDFNKLGLCELTNRGIKIF